MNKSCLICKHSVEVKYSISGCGTKIYQREVVFCIALPPVLLGRKDVFHFGEDFKKGENKLRQYWHYPVVYYKWDDGDSSTAPCSMYCKIGDVKMSKYTNKLAAEKKKEKKEWETERKKKEEELAAARKKRKEELEIEKKKREEDKKRKKRLKCQREYRKKKKQETKILKEEQRLQKIEEMKIKDRFEILDI